MIAQSVNTLSQMAAAEEWKRASQEQKNNVAKRENNKISRRRTHAKTEIWKEQPITARGKLFEQRASEVFHRALADRSDLFDFSKRTRNQKE
jgi:hypothetical protein